MADVKFDELRHVSSHELEDGRQAPCRTPRAILIFTEPQPQLRQLPQDPAGRQLRQVPVIVTTDVQLLQPAAAAESCTLETSAKCLYMPELNTHQQHEVFASDSSALLCRCTFNGAVSCSFDQSQPACSANITGTHSDQL